jgi:hypothetical protein
MALWRDETEINSNAGALERSATALWLTALH